MVMVLQKRGNVFFHNKQHKGGSIQIHHVSENENEHSLSGGLATKFNTKFPRFCNTITITFCYYI